MTESELYRPPKICILKDYSNAGRAVDYIIRAAGMETGLTLVNAYRCIRPEIIIERDCPEGNVSRLPVIQENGLVCRCIPDSVAESWPVYIPGKWNITGFQEAFFLIFAAHICACIKGSPMQTYEIAMSERSMAACIRKMIPASITQHCFETFMRILTGGEYSDCT